MRKVLLVLPMLLAGPSFGQTLEPGEWEFSAHTTSPLFPRGQNMVFKRCVTPEDAANPERWIARHNEKNDCKLTPREKTPKSMKWEMSCARTNIRGSGVAWITGPGTVESEMNTTSEFQGHRIEMNTRTSGRRLGPCKT